MGVNIPDVSSTDLEPLRGRFPNVEPTQLEVMSLCLDYDPDRRATCTFLFHHSLLFTINLVLVIYMADFYLRNYI